MSRHSQADFCYYKMRANNTFFADTLSYNSPKPSIIKGTDKTDFKRFQSGLDFAEENNYLKIFSSDTYM